MEGRNIADELLGEFGGIELNNLINVVKETENEENEPMLINPTQYIDLENIENFTNIQKNGFTILSVNIQSINAKFHTLTAIIKHLNEVYKFQFSAICLQETWLDENSDTSQLEIPGYKIFSQGKQSCPHGGLITYLHNDYKGKKVNLYKKSKSKLWEGQHITITGDRLKNKLSISNIYRPPKYNNNNLTITNFMKEFFPYVQDKEANTSNQIIAGDFNINLLDLQNREKYEEYFDTFITSGYLPRITLPTRFSSKKCTLIDNIFTSFANPMQINSSYILATKLSDHLPCILSFEIAPKPKKSQNTSLK